MAGYKDGKDSLYEILEIDRGATAGQIERAYQRLRTESEKDAAPPEMLAFVCQAHEVLSDPSRRAAYDATLKSDELLRPEPARPVSRGAKWAPIGIALAAVLAGLWFLLRPSGDAERIPPEIVAAAAPAVGRVQVIDLSGKATTLGNAFTIDQGVMLTACQEFRANTHVLVRFGSRTAPASVTKTDGKLGLCRLSLPGSGSYPLSIGTTPPKAGDKVYAVTTNPVGEIEVTDVRVRSLVPVESGQALELGLGVTAAESGGPVLDARGRVIGMMSAEPAFAGRNLAVPVSWIQQMRATAK